MVSQSATCMHVVSMRVLVRGCLPPAQHPQGTCRPLVRQCHTQTSSVSRARAGMRVKGLLAVSVRSQPVVAQVSSPGRQTRQAAGKQQPEPAGAHRKTFIGRVLSKVKSVKLQVRGPEIELKACTSAQGRGGGVGWKRGMVRQSGARRRQEGRRADVAAGRLGGSVWLGPALLAWLGAVQCGRPEPQTELSK